MFLNPTESVPSAVQLLKLPEVGVPRTGVVSEGEVERTLLPEPVEVVTPVPPLRTGSAVPDNVTASVPLLVIGVPETERNEGTVIATELTVPDAPLDVSRVTTPELFLAYSFMSAMFNANSPLTKFPAEGTAAAVVL
jgi:hypothetical protein